MKNSMIRCTRCILPDGYPEYIFRCTGYLQCVQDFWIQVEGLWLGFEKKRTRRSIFDKIKAKRRRYDCMVPVSGGKDSAYALYICTHKYKLKTLAVNFNNGFTSPMLMRIWLLWRRNLIQTMCHGDQGGAHYRRHIGLFSWKRSDFCPPCSRAITSYTYRLAQKERNSFDCAWI